MRGIFHSLSRSLGDFDDNGYEGSNSHTDKAVTYESTSLEFKWAPLSVDVVTKFKSLKSSPKPMPDLIIAGGGVLDKLQLSITHEDARVEVKKMAEVLSNSNEMVCWFTPPTINTPALNSDDKRLHINEDAIEEMRQLYHELGVLSSASFVLDGPSFTKDRVLEAYDGIQVREFNGDFSPRVAQSSPKAPVPPASLRRWCADTFERALSSYNDTSRHNSGLYSVLGASGKPIPRTWDASCNSDRAILLRRLFGAFLSCPTFCRQWRQSVPRGLVQRSIQTSVQEIEVVPAGRGDWRKRY